jgi:hypothetical protein
MEKILDTVNQNVQNALKKFQITRNKEQWADTETNKWTQRGLQQTPQWNIGHYKKRDIWIKDKQNKI